MDDIFDRKRLLYRSINRGVKETDLLLGNFARENIFLLSKEQVQQYALVVETNDDLLYKYLVERMELPTQLAIIKKIIEFNRKYFTY